MNFKRCYPLFKKPCVRYEGKYIQIMEKLTKEEFEELNKICKQITILKLKRIKKFGKNWHVKLNGFGRTKRAKAKIDKSVIDSHLRKMDETMALKNYTIGKLLGSIGLSRNVYSDMRNGYCSGRVNSILSNINWDNL